MPLIEKKYLCVGNACIAISYGKVVSPIVGESKEA